MQNSPVDVFVTESGIPVVTENVPGSSAGFMTAVRTGSRDERQGIFGLSHLLEHTVFRETRNMNSFEMAKVMEGAGGELNAFTAKEVTAFYGVTLSETADVAMRCVADIVANPLISEEDTALEKEIVLQELNMVRNDPEEYIHDLFTSNLWAGHPLGWDEGGSPEDVEPLTSADLRQYYGERYGRPNLAVFATGSFDVGAVRSWAEESFSGMEAPVVNRRSPPPTASAKFTAVDHHADQIQIAMGFPTPKVNQHDHDVLALLSAVLGAGTSSRLFQQVRERNALVYSVYSMSNSYSDAGYLATFMSCTGKNVLKAIDETNGVLRTFLREGFEEGELQRVKNLLKGELSRAAETTDHRIYSLCKNYMTFGTVRSTREALESLSSVTEDEVMAAAQTYIRADRLNVTVLGKTGKSVKEFDVASVDY